MTRPPGHRRQLARHGRGLALGGAHRARASSPASRSSAIITGHVLGRRRRPRAGRRAVPPAGRRARPGAAARADGGLHRGRPHPAVQLLTRLSAGAGGGDVAARVPPRHTRRRAWRSPGAARTVARTRPGSCPANTAPSSAGLVPGQEGEVLQPANRPRASAIRRSGRGPTARGAHPVDHDARRWATGPTRGPGPRGPAAAGRSGRPCRPRRRSSARLEGGEGGRVAARGERVVGELLVVLDREAAVHDDELGQLPRDARGRAPPTAARSSVHRSGPRDAGQHPQARGSPREPPGPGPARSSAPWSAARAAAATPGRLVEQPERLGDGRAVGVESTRRVGALRASSAARLSATVLRPGAPVGPHTAMTVAAATGRVRRPRRRRPPARVAAGQPAARIASSESRASSISWLARSARSTTVEPELAQPALPQLVAGSDDPRRPRPRGWPARAGPAGPGPAGRPRPAPPRRGRPQRRPAGRAGRRTAAPRV